MTYTRIWVKLKNTYNRHLASKLSWYRENINVWVKQITYLVSRKVGEANGITFVTKNVISKKSKKFLLRFSLDNFQFSKGKHFKNKVLPQLERMPQKIW